MWGWRARVLRPCVSVFLLFAPAASAEPAKDVVAHYADIAQAAYTDSLRAAQELHAAITVFVANPTERSLEGARAKWKAARIPYLQTEGFRFANATVDAWEPRVNAWPIDEGLIDYVGPAYGKLSDENPLYTLNVISRTKLRIGPKEVDARTIDEKLLRSLQQAEGVQTNVSTGYHVIEFLLWGQPVRGSGPGIGRRLATDYDLKRCTHGNCARRVAYLEAAAGLLVNDLKDMAADWGRGGAARKELLDKGADGGLGEILTGLGSLTFGEMAGERMKLGLMLHDPEEAQDCFSDNTHNAHFYDEVGIQNIWTGRYVTPEGHKIDGASLRSYASSHNRAAAQRLDVAIANALAKIRLIKAAADGGRMGYDQMIAAGNGEGNALIRNAMDALVAQTHAIEAVAGSLKLQVASNRSDRTVAGLH